MADQKILNVNVTMNTERSVYELAQWFGEALGRLDDVSIHNITVEMEES